MTLKRPDIGKFIERLWRNHNLSSKLKITTLKNTTNEN